MEHSRLYRNSVVFVTITPFYLIACWLTGLLDAIEIHPLFQPAKQEGVILLSHSSSESAAPAEKIWLHMCSPHIGECSCKSPLLAEQGGALPCLPSMDQWWLWSNSVINFPWAAVLHVRAAEACRLCYEHPARGSPAANSCSGLRANKPKALFCGAHKTTVPRRNEEKESVKQTVMW